MSLDRRALLAVLGAAALIGCGGGNAARMPRPGGDGRVGTPEPGAFPSVGFADWSDAEPDYLLYPGDEIDVATPSAIELNRTVKVGPDGRIALPLIGQVMAADRSLPELERDLSAAYAGQLMRPTVAVTLKQAGPLKVWVDGEVRNPGVFDMPGDIDAWQAVIMAGGFLPSAKRGQVALVRRGPGGVRMMRALDLRPPRGEVVALRRSDVLFAPRTSLAEVAVFFTQVREALPIGFNYTLNGQYQQF